MMMVQQTADAETTIAARTLIYRCGLMMDEQRYEEWLETLCTEDFEYTITTYSHEIRREQEWMRGTREELLEMMRLMPYHNTDHSPLTRHISVYTVAPASNGTLVAVSSVMVHQNMLDSINSHLDSGESRLFAVGKYYDEIKISAKSGRPLLYRRNMRLDTRRLDKGSHFPL